MDDAPPAPSQGSYDAGSGIFVRSQPDEIGVPLRKDDFLTLCEGETSQARSSRDMCIGVCGTAFVGFLGVLAAIDWDTVLKWGHLKLIIVIFLIVVLLIATSGSAVAAYIHNKKVKNASLDSPYSRLRARLQEAYDALNREA